MEESVGCLGYEINGISHVRKGSFKQKSLNGKQNLREECNLPKGISGISSPWFYVGSRYSLFPLHLEDNNLRSLNIHLGGAPKVWFGFHFEDDAMCHNSTETCAVLTNYDTHRCVIFLSFYLLNTIITQKIAFRNSKLTYRNF